MYDATIIDVRTSLNLNSEEKVMVVDLSQWEMPSYEDMSLEEILAEDTKPTVRCASMDEIREEKEELRLLEQVLTLQDRMAKGMAMIQEHNGVRLGYIVAKNKFDKAKEMMFSNKNRKPQSWWNRFNQLKAERDEAWQAYESVRTRLNKLWSHWMRLKDECSELATSSVWAQYFEHQNKDLTEYFTYNGDVQEQSVETWFSAVDEIFRDTHIEEQAEYDVEVHLPVKTGGYVPPCRDVTHLYMSKEELDSLMASCPF